MGREKRGSEGVYRGDLGRAGVSPKEEMPRLLPHPPGEEIRAIAWGPQSQPTPCPVAPFSSSSIPHSPLTPGCSGAAGLRTRPRPREVTRARAHTWAWLRLEPGLPNPTLASPSRRPGQCPGRPHGGQAATVCGAGPPAAPRPSPLTQHVHGVQPGVLPRRVVGHAGVGARVVRGHQALQHQGAAVQVEPVPGGGAGSRCVRGGGPAAWGGEGTGQALPEVGAHALAQRAAVLQPGHLGRRLPIGFAVQPHLLPLQDAVLLRGARAPDPGGRCGRGCGEARAVAGAA